MTDLSQLLEKVRTATGPDRELDVAIEVALPFGGDISHSHRPSTARGKVTCRYNSGSSGTYNAPRFTSSAEDALRLAERKLPAGVDMALKLQTGGKYFHAEFETEEGDEAAYNHPSLPLAILTATISALISKEKADG